MIAASITQPTNVGYRHFLILENVKFTLTCVWHLFRNKIVRKIVRFANYHGTYIVLTSLEGGLPVFFLSSTSLGAYQKTSSPQSHSS